MNEYFLQLVGLRIVLRTPYEITISENLKPFLCQPQEETDCTIRLQPCASLPAISPFGVWHGMECYERQGNAVRIFHCNAPATAAFAMTQLLENGNTEIHVLPDYLSYFVGSTGILNRIGIETLLQQHQGLLLHASLIKYTGRSIAFTGPSGVGKSTQASLWEQYLNAEIINGDRAALRKEAEDWIAYGSPYAGTSGIYRNDSAPLAAIVLLRQAKENRLCLLNCTEAFRWLYPELSIHHWDREFVIKATDRCLQLLAEVPVYLLECCPDESAVLLVKKGIGL